MAVEYRWILLGRLKRAVSKIKIILNFNVHRWKQVSMISKNRLSFNDRPGLRACVPDSDPISSRRIQRTMSYPSEDDVNKRADVFIANFYKQLQIERQISLELRYCRGNSFESVASP
ncbi:hypothetical protein F511_34918 [Dorcoceras hygrometricum]|uniref:Uncharacterized protein n=1 Tax=Dorcoceras hygrometricum TaxID=472368 RepID=A0A2Z7BQ98_9LAMI|nr:hypothetical protein F511_43835 [Dorcoceras hygrometricum]KZV58178.1 hypothetical protein F511_34918 [Dorcoceras hygrometricum]